MCPQCEKPLIGSATKGRQGKYYSAYHWDKRGHYFRVTKKEFDKTVDMNIVMDYIKYFLENMEYLLLEHKDTMLRANTFSILFDEAPTYDEINYGPLIQLHLSS